MGLVCGYACLFADGFRLRRAFHSCHRVERLTLFWYCGKNWGDAGFQAKGAGRKTNMMLMDFALSQEKRRALERDAGVYELVEPVLQIASTGYVEHV